MRNLINYNVEDFSPGDSGTNDKKKICVTDTAGCVYNLFLQADSPRQTATTDIIFD